MREREGKQGNRNKKGTEGKQQKRSFINGEGKKIGREVRRMEKMNQDILCTNINSL